MGLITLGFMDLGKIDSKDCIESFLTEISYYVRKSDRSPNSEGTAHVEGKIRMTKRMNNPIKAPFTSG